MQRASLAASFHTNAPTAAPIEIPMLALFRSMKPTGRSRRVQRRQRCKQCQLKAQPPRALTRRSQRCELYRERSGSGVCGRLLLRELACGLQGLFMNGRQTWTVGHIGRSARRCSRCSGYWQGPRQMRASSAFASNSDCQRSLP